MLVGSRTPSMTNHSSCGAPPSPGSKTSCRWSKPNRPRPNVCIGIHSMRTRGMGSPEMLQAGDMQSKVVTASAPQHKRADFGR